MVDPDGEETSMAGNGPDPAEFMERAQRMLRELFGEGGLGGGADPWEAATRSGSRRAHHEPSPDEQRENLTFALATRAVEALEDLALNVAAIRQRMERADTGAPAPGAEEDGQGGAHTPG
jgi:hypothetical protein